MTPESAAAAAAPLTPAPYGQACVGCSRAKCKCFYRIGGASCERCHRLGKPCESAPAVRKRKARRTPPPPPPAAAAAARPAPAAAPALGTRIEEKLDDLVTLLRSQRSEKQTQVDQNTPQSMPPEEATAGIYSAASTPATTRENPDIVLDTDAGVMHILRPDSPPMSSSVISDDVSVHQVPEGVGEEQLDVFRDIFIPMFPAVHLPVTTSAAQLRSEKPFLWLVIMALTSRDVAQQFAMGETIWQVISRRIVSQNYADLDLLLGVVCFAAWSHYFKKDKPFMSMLSQLAVSLAFELDLHRDVPPAASIVSRRRSLLPARQRIAKQHPRTTEERRTMLAVFHLTSSTWSSYRKTEPLRWTPYLSECLHILSEQGETHLDILLVTQIRCQRITNQLTCPPADESEIVLPPPPSSSIVAGVLSRQLNDIRQNLPDEVASHRSAQFYLCYTGLKIREYLLGKPRHRPPPDQRNPAVPHLERIQDLESVLGTIEQWLALYAAMPKRGWLGFTSDVFTQFTQHLVVLFKLSVLEEPGWDLREARWRADVFAVLDRAYADVDQLPGLVGMTDADGPRRGLFFRMKSLLRDMKTLFLAELPPDVAPVAAFPTPSSESGGGNGSYGGADFAEDFAFTDELLMSLMQEDILAPGWDFRPNNSYIPFDS
ncbi:hypothetical protein M426DRAFT_323349, partial [Hypoxylon sp. CI-4A]